MHGRERVRIGCHDIHSAAVCRLHVLIPNRAFALGHRLRAWHIFRIMDQHRRIEIALAEHHRDVWQMGTDRVTVLRVGRIVDAHVDRATVVEEQEMVRRTGLSKPITIAPR